VLGVLLASQQVGSVRAPVGGIVVEESLPGLRPIVPDRAPVLVRNAGGVTGRLRSSCCQGVTRRLPFDDPACCHGMTKWLSRGG
jgi:hypothetical protein